MNNADYFRIQNLLFSRELPHRASLIVVDGVALKDRYNEPGLRGSIYQAAPDLYEAAKTMIEWYTINDSGYTFYGEQHPFSILRAAVERAEEEY